MKTRLLFVVMVTGALIGGRFAAAQTAEPTFDELDKNHDGVLSKDEVAAMVKQLADDSRKDGGVQRFDAVVWDGHANHFHLIEAWSDRTARQAHALADHTRQFRAKLVPFEGALYDERIYEATK